MSSAWGYSALLAYHPTVGLVSKESRTRFSAPVYGNPSLPPNATLCILTLRPNFSLKKKNKTKHRKLNSIRTELSQTNVNKQNANHCPDTENKFSSDDVWWDSSLDSKRVSWTEIKLSQRRAVSACRRFRLCLAWKNVNEKQFRLEYYQFFDLNSPDFWRICSHRFSHLGHTRATEWVVRLNHALLPTMQRRRLKLRGFRTRYACVNTACFTKVWKRNKFRYRVEDSWRAVRRRRGMKSRMRQPDRWEPWGSPPLGHRAPFYRDLLQKLLITKWASKINTRLTHDSQTGLTDHY